MLMSTSPKCHFSLGGECILIPGAVRPVLNPGLPSGRLWGGGLFMVHTVGLTLPLLPRVGDQPGRPALSAGVEELLGLGGKHSQVICSSQRWEMRPEALASDGQQAYVLPHQLDHPWSLG